jgi:hypothetical protein
MVCIGSLNKSQLDIRTPEKHTVLLRPFEGPLAEPRLVHGEVLMEFTGNQID